MRKILLLIISLIVLSPLYANPATSSSSLELSGFKEGSSSSIENTTVTVTAFTSDTVIGRGNEYVILDDTVDNFSNYQLANAFAITISTTSKNPVNVAITLTPFINLSDTHLTVPAVYTYRPVEPTVFSAPTNASTYIRINNRNRSCNNFKITPSINLKQNNSTVNSNTAITVADETRLTLTQGVSSVSYKYSGTTYTDAFVPTEYNSRGTALSTTTLPPNGNSPTVSTTVRFDLSVDPSYFNKSSQGKILANQYYGSTVTLTISGT
ncbi:MAG: hypothetical protein IJT86_04060 [Spirochaetales bacterium]|nr:hypothetical protein [Spirochaetales bacterium]MBQ7729508.1 hypothetical protein [Spirochaetales bacterium]